jgi:hypothetical protein
VVNADGSGGAGHNGGSPAETASGRRMHGLDHGVVYLNLDNGTARLLAESSHCSKPWARRQARSARLARGKNPERLTRIFQVVIGPGFELALSITC